MFQLFKTFQLGFFKVRSYQINKNKQAKVHLAMQVSKQRLKVFSPNTAKYIINSSIILKHISIVRYANL